LGHNRVGRIALWLSVIALATSATPGIQNWRIAGPLYGLAAILGAVWAVEWYQERGQKGYKSRVNDVREDADRPGFNVLSLELFTPGFEELAKPPIVTLLFEGVRMETSQPEWGQTVRDTPVCYSSYVSPVLGQIVASGRYMVRWDEAFGLGTRPLTRPHRFKVRHGRVQLRWHRRLRISLVRLQQDFRKG
jgi:hypothetical protein